MRTILIMFFGFLATGCVSGFLDKYINEGSTRTNQKEAKVASSKSVAPVKPSRSTIYAIDDNTFRIHLGFETVWNGAIEILIRDYNLNVVDKSSMVITTEWDSVYLEGDVYRNKVSMRLKYVNRSTVDLSVHNNTERLQPDNGKGSAQMWLPSGKGAKEIGRLIQNLAVILKQPIPDLPQEMIAVNSVN